MISETIMENTSTATLSSATDIDNLIQSTRMKLESLKTAELESKEQETSDSASCKPNKTPIYANKGVDTLNDEKDCDADSDIDIEQKSRGRPSACVFVASLCSTLTDDQLCVSVTEHFEKWGDLSTVKVLRDTSNRPYAFVQYVNENDSKTAIKEGHNSVLNGRNIRCEAAKVNRTLFVRSRYIVSESSLKRCFEKFGELENITGSDRYGNIVSKHGKGLKYWYCKFAFRDDAIRAFANLSESKEFITEWAQNIDEIYKKNEKTSVNKFPKFDKFSIFVGQLNNQTTEEDLKKRFETHGEIEEVIVIRKINSSFGFIKYKKESSAATAVERENHALFNNKTMHVQYREMNANPTRSISNKYGGLALAPPPINLGKRLVSQKSIKFNDSSNQIKNKLNHYTFPLTSKKYFEADNRYNKENYLRERTQKIINPEKLPLSPLKQSNIANLPIQNKIMNSYSDINITSPYDNPQSPISPVNKIHLTANEFNNYPYNQYNSDIPKSKESQNSKLDDVSIREYSPIIANEDMHPRYLNKVPNDYYYPYQQIYFPYDPNQVQYIYGLPTVPIYFPRSVSENGFANDPAT